MQLYKCHPVMKQFDVNSISAIAFWVLSFYSVQSQRCKIVRLAT